MSARLTVVLDDEGLYREAKVRAAREGIRLKDIISQALAEYLRSGPRVLNPGKRKRLTVEMLDRWREESLRMDAELPDDFPTDLSDIKHHLYGWPKQSERHPANYAAEETADYDR